MRRATNLPAEIAHVIGISIHALHEESDLPLSLSVVMSMISIHALHEESDPQFVSACRHVVDISIHALHEESDSR